LNEESQAVCSDLASDVRLALGRTLAKLGMVPTGSLYAPAARLLFPTLPDSGGESSAEDKKMAIHVEKDGWKVTGDSLEELELGIAAVQRALERDAQRVTRGPGRPRGRTKNGRAAANRKFQETKKTILAFLRTINGATEGATAEDLVTALKLKHKRALGSPAGVVNRTLESLRFEPTTVYVAEKKFNQPRRWYPRPRIEDAIEAIDRLEKKP